MTPMRPVTDLFGPNVDLLWANKRSKRGKFVKMGKTAGCTLPPEISEALSQGYMHYANGSHSEALEHLSKVTRLAPHLPDPFHIMGLIYEESGDKLASLQFFVLAAVHTPKSADVWMKVCDLATDLKQYDQAMSALNHALKREKSVSSYVKKILLLIKMDQVNSAKHQLKLFLDKYPEEIPFLADYAYACQTAGYLEMATQSYLRLAYHIMGSKDVRMHNICLKLYLFKLWYYYYIN
jgi:tetratricopeptide (TPR) repeat protein